MSITTRRQSVRIFNDNPIKNEKIKGLLEAGMAAPSSKNNRPWQFIVLDDKEIIEGFADAHSNWKILKNTDKVIIVCGDLKRDEREKHMLMACSAATQNILLRAVELEIGAVWLGLYPDSVRTDYTRETLNVPEHIVPVSLIALGNYDSVKEKNRVFDEEIVHNNAW